MCHTQDLTTGKDVMEPIPGTSGDVEWANDNNTLFYVVKDHLDRYVCVSSCLCVCVCVRVCCRYLYHVHVAASGALMVTDGAVCSLAPACDTSQAA